jgi:hypothetical protein
MLKYIPVIFCTVMLLPLFAIAQEVSAGDSSGNNSLHRRLEGNTKRIQALHDSLPGQLLKSSVRSVNNVHKTISSQMRGRIEQKIGEWKKALSVRSMIPTRSVSLEKISADYTGITDTSFLQSGSYYYRHDARISSAWSVMDIPFSTGFQHQYVNDGFSGSMFNIDLRFDKELHLRKMQQRIRNQIDMSAITNPFGDPVELLKNQAKQSLSADLKSVSASFDGVLEGDLQSMMNNPEMLFNTNMQQWKQQLLSEDFVGQVNQQQDLLRSLRERKALGGTVDDKELKQLELSTSKLTARQELIKRIAEHRERWENSGLLKKMKESEMLKAERIGQALKDPAFIRSEARRLVPLKGLERFFLNVNRLNIGRDALSLSPMSFQHFLHNGISTEFIGGKGQTFMFMAGKQKDFASVADNGFEQSLFSNNSQMKAFRFGFPQGKRSASQVTVSSFNQSMNSMLGSPFTADGFRKILVTTISNQINLSKTGLLTVDLSRSATSYQESGAGSDSVFKTNNPFNRILSGDNFMDNTALAVRFSDEISSRNLSYQFNFSKVANGYNNPGNTFLAGGSMEIGGGFRKTVLQQRLQISFRSNLKEYNYNDDLDRKWKNMYAVADVKWKMKKGQHIGIRYQPNRMIRVENGSSFTASVTDRLSVESNLYKKLGRHSYRNFVTMAYQFNRYMYSTADIVSATSFQLSSFQNFNIGSRLLYANISYTMADNRSQYVFFNSSFNGDLGCSYNFLKKINASSGLVYSSVNEWYQQLGLRQTVSGNLGEHFSVSMFVDYRKNIRVTQSMWNQPVRADIALKYMFK